MTANILIVDDERSIGIALQRLLGARGHVVDTVLSGEDAIAALEARPYHLVVTDLNLPGMSGLDVLRWVKEQRSETAVLMITAYGSERLAVEAMKLGAADYIPKPFDNDELEVIVERALETAGLRRDLRLLREHVASNYRLDNMIGKSAAMQRVFDIVRKVADTDLTVLIRGASGTGKELVANAIHYNSPRRAKPIIKVNCAAFARELVESELFGHERGAFTGAISAREGKFELADGGSLLLDEIGDMPLETQAKILRVLQERELERVGGSRPIRVDVRILAATNQDLEARVCQGAFREDLYYRLKVVQIDLPALRERPEDLPLLIEHFLATIAQRLKRPPKKLAADAYRALLGHEWRGNIRELEHTIEQAFVLAAGDELQAGDFPFFAAPADVHAAAPDDSLPASFRDAKQRIVEQFERNFIVAALARHQGNISKAAEEMGMYRQHLQVKLAEYGIDAAAHKQRGGA